jgi:RND family efflux transporter MFP subunit
MNRTVSISIVALLLLPLSACHKPEASAQAAQPLKLPPAAAARAATSEVAVAPAGERWFEVSGTAQAARTTRLSMKAGGVLRSIKVREGQRVQADEVLCELDPIDIQLRVEGAQVAVAQADEGVRSAESDLKRAQSMFDGGALTDQAIEKANLGVKMARLQLKGAQVALRMAQQALADTQLKAPFGGVVTKVLAEEGQFLTTMPPAMVFVLVDTDTLEVRAPIPERRLAQIKVGQEVQVVLPAMGLTRTGRIDRMADVVDPMTRAAEAIIRLDNVDHAVAAGLFASVRFPGVTADAADAPTPAPAAVPPAPATPATEG